MDVLKPIVEHITAPLYSRRAGYVYGRQIRELERSQWLPREEIEELQNRRLRQLIEFVFDNNEFYRDRMKDIGVIPSDIRSKADLRALPLLSKQAIRQAGKRMFSVGFDEANTLHTRTGGSTGVPLHVHVDKEAMNWKYAATWRHNHWAGWRRGTKVAAVWGDTDKSFHLKDWLRFVLQNRTIYLDTLNFTDAKLSDFHERILNHKPTVLMGHAHSVFKFARFCADRQLRTPGICSVVTTAMTLSDRERSVIEEVFETRVFNRYGCEELSVIATESEVHSGLHVFSEGLILEYSSTEVEGEFELIVTDLLNRAMPMIRYSIEDVVKPMSGECPSGRGLEKLERVSGRTADFLYRRDGTPVFGISLLDTYIIHIAGISQAQIVQNTHEDFVINVVPDEKFGVDTKSQLYGVLETHFGRGLRIEIVKVDELEKTERGKYRFSICNLPSAPADVNGRTSWPAS